MYVSAASSNSLETLGEDNVGEGTTRYRREAGHSGQLSQRSERRGVGYDTVRQRRAAGHSGQLSQREKVGVSVDNVMVMYLSKRGEVGDGNAEEGCRSRQPTFAEQQRKGLFKTSLHCLPLTRS